MGTYYRYVNFTRREFVSLSGLREGGSKENAALYCAPALAWLLVYPHTCGDGYRGRWRWRSWQADRPADDVQIVSDGAFDFYDMEEKGFLNITPGLLQSLRVAYPGLVGDYQPRLHDVNLSIHLVENGLYKLLETTSAACKCGWKAGPLYGDYRVEALEQVVADHVNSRKSEGRPQDPRPFSYRAELSSDDVCNLIDALDAITSDKGREFESDAAPRLIALRDRLADLKGTR